jgi:hypothetical protein
MKRLDRIIHEELPSDNTINSIAKSLTSINEHIYNKTLSWEEGYIEGAKWMKLIAKGSSD